MLEVKILFSCNNNHFVIFVGSLHIMKPSQITIEQAKSHRLSYSLAYTALKEFII